MSGNYGREAITQKGAGRAERGRRRRRRSLWRRLTPMCKGVLFMSLAILGICLAALCISDRKKSALADMAKKMATAAPASESHQDGGFVRNKNIVCLDAGHGGKDGGASDGDMVEKTHTLTIATLVKRHLETQGIKVVMTRESDESVSLERRISIANNSNACALISIHRNDYQANSAVGGVEAWISADGPQDAKELARHVLKRLDALQGFDSRGVKTGTMNNAQSNYYVNEHSAMASLVLELGFITNDRDNEIIITRREAVAKAIADGILDYIKTLN